MTPEERALRFIGKLKHKDNASGYKGVCWNKRAQGWRAEIMVNGLHLYLGYYDTPEEAHAAYCQAAVKYFGQFACEG